MLTKAYDGITIKIIRRLQLARGHWWRLCGVTAGLRFGLGPGVRVFYPRCLTVGDDVTIEGPAYLHCLSERGVHIGSHSSFGPNLWLHCGGSPEGYNHGYVEIGEHAFIGANGVLGAGGGIRIGSHGLIGQSVNIHAENHLFDDLNRLIREQGVSYQGIVIEDDVWIGSKSTILDGVTIGRGAVVAAGAVVNESVPSMAIVAGVPARVIRWRNQET